MVSQRADEMRNKTTIACCAGWTSLGMGDITITGVRLHAIHARTISDCQGTKLKYSGGFLSVMIAT